MKKTLLARALVAGAALTLVAPATAPVAQASEVHVPDAGLRQCLNVHLDQPADAALTEAQLASIEELDCGSTKRRSIYHIEDLTGVEHLTGATTISLMKNDFSDLSPLSELTQLESLDLRLTHVVDLAPLSGLVNLEYLNLGINGLTDVSALSGLTSLTDLTLLRNSIEDITPVAGLDNLQTLRLEQNHISDASALQTLTRRGDVDLSLRFQNAVETIEVGDAVAVPRVMDAFGTPVKLTTCERSYSADECMDDVSVAGNEMTFVPEVAGFYNLRFEGNGSDDFSFNLRVDVKTPALEKVYFTDNPTGSKFYTPVQWLAAEGLSVGYADGTFKKERTISRGETAQLMYRMTGEPAPAEDISFPDTRPVFQDAMAWFAQEGISVGYADGTFKPARSVTRGEVATFLYRMHQPEGFTAGSQVPFPDVPATSAHREAIAWLAETGISTGYTDGTFRADRTLSRGEIAAFLHRYDALAQ